MASFKFKPDKVKYLNIVKTLDETHQKIASDFYENRNCLPQKIIKLKELNKNLEYISDNKLEITNEIIRKKSTLKEEIKNLENEIDRIKKGTDEIEYYTKTGDILMDYYNLLDNDDISTNNINLCDINSSNLSLSISLLCRI